MALVKIDHIDSSFNPEEYQKLLNEHADKFLSKISHDTESILVLESERTYPIPNFGKKRYLPIKDGQTDE